MPAPSPHEQRRALLAEALELTRQLNQRDRNEVDCQKRQVRLRQIREALRAYAHPLQTEPLPVDSLPLSVRQAFVRAVVLVTRYAETGGEQWHSTLPSPTLSRYRPDPVPPELAAPEFPSQLCQRFALSPVFATEVTTALAMVDRQIEQRRRIIQSVLAECGDWTPDAIARLFQQCFGPLPIPPAALDLVCTDMQLYFCLKHRDGQLDLSPPDAGEAGSKAGPLNETEQQQIQTFLASLGQFSFEQFRRFPVFGPCSPTHIDRDWCDRIAQRAGLTVAEVLQVLPQAVSIIPTHKAEAFLLHDIWGHHWQLLLSQFHSDYAILATCNEPLRGGETAYTPHGPLRCSQIFQREGDEVTLDAELAYLFFHGEVQQRLGLLFTHLIGEMVADAAEFKFVLDYPEDADLLLSSSLFKAEPTKLDLSLGDVDFLFLRVLEPLLTVQLSALTESPLEQDLLQDWAAAGELVPSLELRASLKQAILQLYQIFLEEYNATYLPTLTDEPGLFSEMVSNLLYFQNALNSLYTSEVATDRPHLPFRDLLLVFIGCYCSSDSYAEFWDVDDALAGYFLPCWQRLAELLP